MARFFFDFWQRQDRTGDETGLELQDVEQAYLEAFKAAQDMWSELLRQRHDPRYCRFEVRGDSGDVLFVLTFQEVLESCMSTPAFPLRRMFHELNGTHHHVSRLRGQLREEIENSRKMLQESHKLLRRVSDVQTFDL